MKVKEDSPKRWYQNQVSHDKNSTKSMHKNGKYRGPFLRWEKYQKFKKQRAGQCDWSPKCKVRNKQV
jgi:hypothetical protein